MRLCRFMEGSGMLSTTQFAYRKGLGTYDALLCMSNTLLCALESVQQAGIVQIDFSSAFEGSTSWAFSISSALWVLEVLCCLVDTVFIKPITACYGGWLSE